MNLDAVAWIQILGYVSLGLELTVLAVPSVASSRQILASGAAEAAPSAGALGVARSRSRIAKLLRYGLPTASGIVLFSLPLALLVVPEWVHFLGPWMDAPPWLRWVGAAAVIGGRIVTLLGAWELRKETLASLAESGVFAFTRNPIVVGMHGFFLGHLLIFPCLVLGVGLVLYAIHMHGRVLMEEDYLADHFGSRYEPYRQRVPRYVLL